ncbi:MAG: hypothetical protein NW215_10630 [Hyphomicrobiales bacterium]|nr:hypothetical protein [Hyphomicrobiales bacterium]
MTDGVFIPLTELIGLKLRETRDVMRLIAGDEYRGRARVVGQIVAAVAKARGIDFHAAAIALAKEAAAAGCRGSMMWLMAALCDHLEAA